MKTKILITVAVLTVFSSLKAQIPTNGLVLNLPLDGSAADSSSYKNVCENHGTTPVTDRTGRAGKAATGQKSIGLDALKGAPSQPPLKGCEVPTGRPAN